jgi:tRNA-binding EMAP/Myf-like protein
MKLSTKNVGSNYLAKIVQINQIEKHPNADKLQLAIVDNQKIIVGMNAKVGDICVYFPIESRINRSFLSFTNCFDDPLLNADGKTKGFFRDSARVRAVKLRGIVSEGYLAPIGDLAHWAGYVNKMIPLDPLIGVEFDTIERFNSDGDLGSSITSELLCEKYVPPQQHSHGPTNTTKKDKTKRFDKLVPGQFNFHIDTPNLKKNAHIIQPDDIITITEKLHGTSAVFANILINRKLSWIEKIAKFFGAKVQETEYGQIYSSRSVVKNGYVYPKEANHWYKEDIWGVVNKTLEGKIEPGITLYGEIVGQTPNGSWIQKKYDYGTAPKEHRFYVYRITSTNVLGQVTEFTTNQIKNYCKKYELNMVPVHHHGPAYDYSGFLEGKLDIFSTKLLEYLTKDFLEKPCKMCKNEVPAEGIVVVVERENFTPLKLKSQAFLLGETAALDEGTIDMETEEATNAMGT